MSPAQRQKSIEYFMNNTDVEVFLVSLKAGGVALNLTEASRVFIIDPYVATLNTPIHAANERLAGGILLPSGSPLTDVTASARSVLVSLLILDVLLSSLV